MVYLNRKGQKNNRKKKHRIGYVLVYVGPTSYGVVVEGGRGCFTRVQWSVTAPLFTEPWRKNTAYQCKQCYLWPANKNDVNDANAINYNYDDDDDDVDDEMRECSIYIYIL